MKIQESLAFLPENPVDGDRGSLKVESCFDMLKHAIFYHFWDESFYSNYNLLLAWPGLG